MSVRSIVFDCGNVLVDFDADRIVRRCGIPERDIPLFEEAAFYDWPALDRGSVPYEEYARRAVSRLPSRLQRRGEEFFRSYPFLTDPVPGMEELVSGLRRQGYSLYVLSNASTYWSLCSSRLWFAPYMKGTLFSADVRMYKPCRNFYEHFFETFSLNREECVFLDDLDINVQASIDAGMKALVFTSAKDAKRALEEILHA